MHTSHTFLGEIAQELYWKYEADLANSTIIFPNTKGAEAFQEIIRCKVDNPILFPRILTLESWVVSLSKIKLASTFDLIILLYEIFQKLHPTKEPFERFYGWGHMLLQDFDIIDKCLVDPAKLFANLYEQKALTLPYDYLTEAQKEAISSFWKTFETRLSNQQQDFLQLWRLLPYVYESFTSHLLKNDIGYLGLCYRKLCNSLEIKLLANHKRLFIIGFNALHPAEEKIFAWLYNHIPTEFYWDIDAYYMDDENQEAGYYLRSHQTKPYFQASFKQPFPAKIQIESKKIKLFEVSTIVGQVHLISKQVQQLIAEQKNDFKPSQAVIVLTDENLFLPMLHALPSSLQSVDTTLGYPIAHTASYQIIEQLLALQVAIRQPTCPNRYFPTQVVIDLLQQPPIRYFNQELSVQTVQSIVDNYTGYVSQDVLAPLSELYQAIFRRVSSAKEIIEYFIDILSLITTRLNAEENVLLPLEKQALIQLREQFEQLQKWVSLIDEVSLESFIKLFRQLIQPIRLPFNQERTTKEAIQILRIWETANLDFEWVFIVGMNEGSLPATTTQGSFIPYSLRKGYGLPTMDTFQASLDAYYFYRLLQRAQQVYITYATPSATSNQKEMSRYLWQLLYESKLPIEKQTIHTAIYTPTVYPIVIQKDRSIVEKLEEFIVKSGKETRTLTPAALNMYMDCSLKFYFRYILELKVPPKLLIEYTDAIRFGSLFHEIIEKLYAPLQTTQKAGSVHKHDIVALRKQVPSVAAQIFSKILYNDYDLQWEGQHLIEQEVIQKVINKNLAIDEKYTPFILLGLEVGKQEPLVAYFKLQSGKTLMLRGIIDRIDLKEGIVRIIDYKTGGDEKYIEKISDLFDKSRPKRNKAVFQTFLYSWIFKHSTTNYASYKIMPIIINTRAIFEPNFDARLAVKQIVAKGYDYIKDITDYQQEFETGLNTLLEEILDPSIPFVQTDNLLHCAKCPYNRICQRH